MPLLFFFVLLLAVPPSSQDPIPCSGYQIDPSQPNVVKSSVGTGPADYQLTPLQSLMRNVCAAEPESVAKLVQSKRSWTLVMVRCEECYRCPQMLPNIQRALAQVAVEVGIHSLLVLLTFNKDMERLRPLIMRQQQQDNSPMLVRFIFPSDEDSGMYCEFSDLSDGDSLKSFSKTSVLFVSISFIILMVISLAWLVFYYVQRFRYAHAKDRLQRRLFNAAKKALARIPTRPVKSGDKELSLDCPICIDPYKPGDICRQLPCRHIFHKSCVDPWLLEHRTCPMCKSDILKAFGYHVSGRRRAQFSAANVEEDGPTGEHEMHRADRMSIESTASESANPFPVVTEVHDPFGFTPFASPQHAQTVHFGPVNNFHTNNLQPEPSSNGDVIQTPIERHSSASLMEEQRTGPILLDSAEQPVAVVVHHHGQPETGIKRPNGTQSAGFRLFRAVTGRRHLVNLVHIRSRSFSQSQAGDSRNSPPVERNREGGRDNKDEHREASAIIYSMNIDEKTRPMEMESEPREEGAPSRAVTAPGGFRRKPMSRGSQRSKHSEEGSSADTDNT